MKSIHKTILRLKLSLGMLILLLKGNDVKGQEIYMWRATCYLRPRFIDMDRVLVSGDASVATAFNLQKNKVSQFTFQLGHNIKKFTPGFRFDYIESTSNLGGYIRYFPYDPRVKGGIGYTVFTETSAMFPLNHNTSGQYLSFSYGLIMRDVDLGGIEFFHSINSDHTLSKGYYSSIGIRLHYYFLGRKFNWRKKRNSWNED